MCIYHIYIYIYIYIQTMNVDGEQEDQGSVGHESDDQIAL